MLRTKRLCLRPLRIQDAAALQKISENSDVVLKTDGIPHPYPIGGALDFIAKSIEAGPSINRYGIFLPANECLIGAIACGLTEAPSELTYMIDPEHWGHGYVTEAARAVLAFCFADVGRGSIFSSAMASNLSSIRVLNKLGFREVTRRSIFSKNRGREIDTIFWCLSRDGWTSVDYRLAND